MFQLKTVDLDFDGWSSLIVIGRKKKRKGSDRGV